MADRERTIYQVQVTVEFKAQIEAAAQRLGISPSDFGRIALADLVSKVERGESVELRPQELG